MALSKSRKMDRGLDSRKEIQPRIVQLGSSIPTMRTDVPYTWSPTQTNTDYTRMPVTPEVATSPVKSAKYKNLFEYNQRHTNTYNFKSNLWKIPSIGNNFLPFKSKGLHISHSGEEVIGLYRPKFKRLYSRLVHENTVILPPIETSQRVKENIYDSNIYNEKKYINQERRTTGPRERFTRDELYLPNVYNQCFTCRECRKQYASEMFNQTWAYRNQHSPRHAGNHTSPRTKEQQQHCDVLGERYCKDCIENRNKTFSLLIEDKLLNNNLNNVHFKPTLY